MNILTLDRYRYPTNLNLGNGGFTWVGTFFTFVLNVFIITYVAVKLSKIQNTQNVDELEIKSLDFLPFIELYDPIEL